MFTSYAVAAAAILGAAVGAAAARGLKRPGTPKAYIVTEVEVTGDTAAFQRDYAAHAQATVEPFGGRYLARGGRNIGIEGEPPKGRIVISVVRQLREGAGLAPLAGLYEDRHGARTRGHVAPVHCRGCCGVTARATMCCRSPRCDCPTRP